MNNEKYNQIIDEVYEKYKKHIETQQDIQKKEVQRLRSQGKRVRVVKIILLTKEEFITKCKTDVEFSERCGLRIEVRELSLEERNQWFHINWNANNPTMKSDWKFYELDQQNVPTKLIKITYNNEKIEVYE